MPKAIRDMQPWRRSLAEHGLTFEWVAARTGVSVHTVQAYSVGARTPNAEWVERVERLVADHVRGNAA